MTTRTPKSKAPTTLMSQMYPNSFAQTIPKQPKSNKTVSLMREPVRNPKTGTTKNGTKNEKERIYKPK